jgi:phosphatidate phosphatase APP1
MRPFLVDNCHDIQPWMTIGSQRYRLPPSDPGGHSETLLRLSNALSGSVSIEAGLPSKEATTQSWGQLVPAEGLSIISDIDDTIKHSEVHDTRRLLRNTFTQPFEPIPGMAEVYRDWAAEGAAFHYVSSSPWQLCSPLLEMLESADFPRGSMHLKRFRLKDRSILSLLKDPRSTKPPIIQALLDAWPKRRFLLVGDAGELDPEIYGQIARDNPNRIRSIHIRIAPGGDDSPLRFRKAFAGLGPVKCSLFTDPKMLVGFS